MQKRASQPAKAPRARSKTRVAATNDVEMQVTDKKRMLEFKARQKASDAAIGHLTRITPPPGAKTNGAFRAMEYIEVVLDIWMLVAAGLEIDVRWNETWDLWRINIGVVALYRSAHTAVLLVCMLFNWWNERTLEEMLVTASGDDSLLGEKGTENYMNAVKELQSRITSPDLAPETRITLPAWNTPSPRLGFTYNAMFATGWILTWVYLYQDLNTGNGINLVTFNDVRTARVFVHIALLLAVADFVMAFIDYFQLVHAGMDGTTKEKHACLALELSHEEALEDYPDTDLVMSFVEPLFMSTTAAATGLATLLCEQIVLGPDAFWSITIVRMVAGICAALCAGFVLLHGVAWVKVRPHKCAGRVMRDSELYWMFFTVGFGIVWLYTFEVTSDAKLSPQSLETYIWWLFTLLGVHLFFTVINKIRSFCSVVWQIVYCPNLYGL